MSDEEQNLPDTSPSMTRAEIAYQMLHQGLSVTDIANELHVHPRSVHRMVEERYAQEASEQTPEYRAGILSLQNDRLNWMYSKLVPQMEYGDTRAITAGMNLVVNILKLHRLDQPEAAGAQNTIMLISGDEDSYIQKLKELSDTPELTSGD